MLGFFQNGDHSPAFVRTTAGSGSGSAFALPAPERDSGSRRPLFLGCRHGRALVLSFAAAMEILVWEPITGYQRRMPLPTSVDLGRARFNAAVACAVDGCNHRDCHGGPFRVVFVSSYRDPKGFYLVTTAWEYSSETGAWGEPIPAIQPPHLPTKKKGSLLVGKSLYFLCSLSEILEYNLSEQRLALIDPADAFRDYCKHTTSLMRAEDGGLGIAGIQESHLYLWSRQRIGDKDAGWVLRRIINLDNLLPPLQKTGGRRVPLGPRVSVAGFYEGANIIFLRRIDGTFTIELNSDRARKVWRWGIFTLLPFLSFYAPGMQADTENRGRRLSNAKGDCSMLELTSSGEQESAELLGTVNQ